MLADNRIVITNKHLSIVDLHSSTKRADGLFEAAQLRIWPRVISNNLACVLRDTGQLRKKLDGLVLALSWVLLLSVKRWCTSTVAARVGEALREVCFEWTGYTLST